MAKTLETLKQEMFAARTAYELAFVVGGSAMSDPASAVKLQQASRENKRASQAYMAAKKKQFKATFTPTVGA
ncbi:MAG: hypothetical protein RBJ76_13805 [Stenomitos frigidus ULC029]